MRMPCLTVGIMLLLLTPTISAAQSRKDEQAMVERRRGMVKRSAYWRACSQRKRTSANKGTLTGGAAGAVVGGAMMAGPVGAGVGALIGHEIGKRRTHC